MTDEELKASVRRRGNGEIKVGDFVTCKEGQDDRYGITKHGVKLEVFRVESNGYQIKVRVVEEGHDDYGDVYDVDTEYFEHM